MATRLQALVNVALFCALVGFGLLLSGCSAAPDEAQVETLVEERLGETFGDGTFALASLRRLGGGPLDPASDGSPRRVVYFNSELTLLRDLDFSSWDTLNIAAFANLMGATEKGITGLEQDGNVAGDQVRVRGSLSFVQRDGDWASADRVQPAAVSGADASAGQSLPSSRRVIERINGLIAGKSADSSKRAEIIDYELNQAYQSISLQLDRLERALIIAGGPADGEYSRVASLLAEELSGRETPSNAVGSSGSAENIELLRAGKADAAMVQNNVASRAQLGTGPFAAAGPFYQLQALASLFPEPVHLIVAKDSPIKGLADLVGQRVEIGRPDSGARYTAIAVLEAAGLQLEQLQAIHETGLESGLALLKQGEADAVIATIGAPSRALQQASARGRIRLLPLSEAEQDALVARGKAYVRMVLPPSTYPGQREPVPTVAVTALMAARAGLPDADVARVLSALFQDIDFVRRGSAAGSLISESSADAGLTIPMHPAAIAFFGKAGEG